MATWGGVERLLLDFLSHSSGSSQFRHLLLTSSIIPEIARPLRESGVPFFHPHRYFKFDPGAFAQMVQWLRKQNASAVHTYNSRANAWGSIISSLARVPVLLAAEHGAAWSVQPPLSWLNRIAYQRASVVVANSNASKRMIQFRYDIAEDKIRVVKNFVAPLPCVDRRELRSALDLEDTDIVVGSVGRVAPEKNFQLFVDAAARLLNVHQGVKFILIGGGSQFSFIKQYIEKLGIKESFLLTGYRDDARELLQTFDVFVSTSLWESFGNAMVEAALAGIPVVAPAIDGIPEVVIDGRTGILLEPTEELPQLPEGVPSKVPNYILVDGQISRPLALNADELSEAISQLLASPDLRAQYGAAARDRACELFTFGRYQRDLESIYEACLSSA